MKKCPNCNMTTESHSDCQVCGYDLSQTESYPAKCEKYSFNKYLFPFIVKKHYFSIICFISVIVLILIKPVSFSFYSAIAILCSLLSICCSLFPEGVKWLIEPIYEEHFFEGCKYIIGTIGILLEIISLITYHLNII